MPPVCPEGMWSLRYTCAPLTTPVAVTEVTGPIRPIIPIDVVGQRRLVAEQGLAGRDPQQVGAEPGQLPVEVGPAGGGDADHRDHRGDADRDARARRAPPAAAGCAGRPAPTRATSPRRQPGGGHRRRLHAGTTSPSRMSTRRGRPAAISRSWVMTTTVVPAACSSRSSAHDLGAGRRVEVAGRLVGQQQRRLADDRPGDRHPLPLAAGQLVRPVVEPVRQPDPVQRRGRPGAAAPAGRRPRRAGRRRRCPAPVPRRRGGTAGRRSRWCGRAARTAAGRTAGPAGARRWCTEPDAGPVQRADQVQHRGLAGAGRADDGDQLAVPDGQRHPGQRGDPARVHLADAGRASPRRSFRYPDNAFRR